MAEPATCPPQLYFSLAFWDHQKSIDQKGSFFFTVVWLAEDQKRRQQLDKDRMLDRALYSVINEKAPRGLNGGHALDRIQLTNYWRNRLIKLGDTALLARYETAILAPLPGRKTTTRFTSPLRYAPTAQS